MFRVVITLLLVLAPAGAGAQDRFGPPEPPRPDPAPPTTKVGSFTPDVYLEELQWPFRDHAIPAVAFPSPHDRKVLLVASDDGHLWRSDDGGYTYDEIRLIVAPSPVYGDAGQRMFRGAHRPSPSPAVVPFRPPAPLPGTGVRLGLDLWSLGTPHQPVVSTRARLLPNLVNRFGRPPAGGVPADQMTSTYRSSFNHLPTSRQQLIAIKGERNSEIWFPIFHPYDPNIVWVCTYYGLFTSYDGGHNFHRTFIGTSPQGREVFEVGVDPADHSRVFLGTGEGSYVSTDGGRNFIRHTGKGIGDWVVFGFYWHPKDHNVMYACTDHGLLRSKDRGSNWDLIYYTTFRPARVARRMAIDPFNPRTAILNTFDGAFITDDILDGGVEDWRRLAPLTFTGFTYMRTVTYCPKHKGHIWSVANLRLPSVAGRGHFITGHSFLFESVDGGKTWKVIFSPTHYARIIWALNDWWDPDLLLIMTDRALVRMRRRSPGAPPPKKKIQLPDDPPVTAVIRAALEHTRTAPDMLLAYRDRARLRSLLPRLEIGYQQHRWTDFDLTHDWLYRALPFRRTGWLSVPYREIRVLFLWDLGDLLFNTDRIFAGRTFRLISQLRDRIVLEVQQAYGRLRQLRVLLAKLPPERRRLRLHYRTRIEETSALLNFHTGGFLTRWRAGRR